MARAWLSDENRVSLSNSSRGPPQRYGSHTLSTGPRTACDFQPILASLYDPHHDIVQRKDTNMKRAMVCLTSWACLAFCGQIEAKPLQVTTANLAHMMSEERFKAWKAYCEPLNWNDDNATDGGASKPVWLTYCNAHNGKLYDPNNPNPPFESLALHNWKSFGQKVDFLRTTLTDLHSDIYALQEVTDEEAVRLIFSASEWDVVATKSAIPQNIAFAIRRNGSTKLVSSREVKELAQLDPDGRQVRPGLEIKISFEGKTVVLLNVHLKAGCRSGPLGAVKVPDKPAVPKTDKAAWQSYEKAVGCYVMRKQAPALENWIEDHAKSGSAFMIVGDWNRDYRRDLGASPVRADGSDPKSLLTDQLEVKSLIKEISDDEPKGANLTVATLSMPERKGPVADIEGKFWPAYHENIDIFAVSSSLMALTTFGSERPGATCKDFGDAAFGIDVARPSDHCPATLVLPFK